MTESASTQPMVTVAVTVRNAATSLPGFVERLGRQLLDVPWEIVVSCGDSTDSSWETLNELAASVPALRIIRSERGGIPAGRNACLSISRGDIIVTCDVDDQPATNWLAELVEAMRDASLVAGRIVLADEPLANVPDAGGEPSLDPLFFLPYGLTANLAFTREVADRIGGFDESMIHGDDVDFTWRAQLAGFRLERCGAVMFKRPRRTATARFRQHYWYGKTDVRLYEKHRCHGMQRNLRKSMRVWAWLVLAAPAMPWSNARRRTWMGVAGHRCGRVVASAQRRCLYL